MRLLTVSIFQSLLLGAGGIGTLGLLALFPSNAVLIAERYFTLNVSDKAVYVALYYGMTCTIVCGLPFHLVAILGTRHRYLIMACLVSSVIVSLHLAIAWLTSLICTVAVEANIMLQVLMGSTFLFSQVAVVAALVSTLKTRNWEEAIGLHSADIVSRQESKQSTVDLVVICPQSS